MREDVRRDAVRPFIFAHFLKSELMYFYIKLLHYRNNYIPLYCHKIIVKMISEKNGYKLVI